MDFQAAIYQSLIQTSLLFTGGIGIVIAYKVFKFGNFAHGDYITVGAYAMAIPLLKLHWNIYLSSLSSIFFSVLSCLLTYYFAVKPLISRKASALFIMIASLAVGILLRFSVYIVVNVIDPYTLSSVISLIPQIVFNSFIPVTDLLLTSLFFTLSLFIILLILLIKTKMGMEIKALADNRELALISGVRPGIIEPIVWIIIGITTGLEGILLNYLGISPEVGFTMLISLFSAAILGGVDSIIGILISSILLGFIDKFTILYLSSTYNVSLNYEPVIPLIAMIIALIFFPRGIANSKVIRKVMRVGV
jgi:branched-subunit amino acid ABC-type transport system permease component